MISRLQRDHHPAPRPQPPERPSLGSHPDPHLQHGPLQLQGGWPGKLLASETRFRSENTCKQELMVQIPVSWSLAWYDCKETYQESETPYQCLTGNPSNSSSQRRRALAALNFVANFIVWYSSLSHISPLHAAVENVENEMTALPAMAKGHGC